MFEKNIVIYGVKKCRNTQKAERFFQERNIKYQFRDLNEKGLAKGELDNFLKFARIDELIDKEGRAYKKKNFRYMVYDPMDLLINNSDIIRTPVIRIDSYIVIGYDYEKLTSIVKGN